MGVYFNILMIKGTTSMAVLAMFLSDSNPSKASKLDQKSASNMDSLNTIYLATSESVHAVNNRHSVNNRHKKKNSKKNSKKNNKKNKKAKSHKKQQHLAAE